MDLNQLRVFLTVYRNRSFTRASEALGLSQPTISEHIKNLEAEFETPLFERLGRKVVPTLQADAIFPRAERILLDAERLREDASLTGARVRGRVQIGASSIPGTYIIPRIAPGFLKKYPDAVLDIKTSDSKSIARSVASYETALGVVGAVMFEDKLDHEPILEDELILAARGGLVPKGQIGIKELQEIPMVLRAEGSGTLKTMSGIFAEKGISLSALKTVAVLDSTDAVKEALKAGLGASVLSRLAVRDEIKRGELREISVAGLKMKRSFFLIKKKGRQLPPPYSVFHDYLIDALRDKSV